METKEIEGESISTAFAEDIGKLTSSSFALNKKENRDLRSWLPGIHNPLIG